VGGTPGGMPTGVRVVGSRHARRHTSGRATLTQHKPKTNHQIR
jgi:hypothetical protein